MNEDDIFKGVCVCIANVLDREPEGIRMEDKVIDDLGADSLDLLDLVFQLEQHFKIRIMTRDLEKRAQEELGGAPMEDSGEFTPEALVQLRKYMPETPPEELSEGLRPADLPYRFRVATFVGLVKRFMEEQQKQQQENNSEQPQDADSRREQVDQIEQQQ